MKIWVNHFPFNQAFLWIALPLLFLASSSSADSFQAQEEEAIYYEEVLPGEVLEDPLEFINRPIFYFNDVCYMYVLVPLNDVYTKVTTPQVRESIMNFFDNLKFPIRLFSNLFQLKIKDASYECIKFTVNTTYGLLGFNKPSDKIAFLSELEEQDFRKVLAYWGVPEGPYLVIPLLGPSTVRDFPTRFIEPIINPFEDIENLTGDTSSEWAISFYTLDVIAVRTEMIDQYKWMKKTSIDPYLSLRSSFFQFKDE